MGMIPPMGPMAGGNSGEAGGFPDGGEGGAGQPGGGRVAQGLSTQLTPGVTWLGAVENVKELGEVIGTLPVDVIFVFDVKVRPATASTWVNNDTRLRVVSAAKVTEALFTSGTINNKGVMEARKKKGAEDPVNQEITEAIAVVENGNGTLPGYKLDALPPIVTQEVALKRIQALVAAKPANALPLLLEARFYVAKKLLKPEEMMTLVMTEVTEDQLGEFGRLFDGEDVKERIGLAVKGPGGDTPKTVLGKFGDALLGAGGLSALGAEAGIASRLFPQCSAWSGWSRGAASWNRELAPSESRRGFRLQRFRFQCGGRRAGHRADAWYGSHARCPNWTARGRI